MKHLKKYKIFEKVETKYTSLEIKEIVDTCKDILLELDDIGFETRIDSNMDHFDIEPSTARPQLCDFWMRFYITNNKKFEYSDIEDAVERLEEYLDGYDLYIQWNSPGERKIKKPTIRRTSYADPATFIPLGWSYKAEILFLHISRFA